MRKRRHPKGNSDHSVAAAVTAAEKAAWTAAAQALGVSVSELIRNSVAQYLEGRRANVLGPPAPRSGARITTQHVSAGQEPTAPVRDAGPTARQRLERARILTADPPPPTGAELTSIHYRRLSPPRSEDHVIYRCPRCGARNEVKLGFTGEPSCGACGYSLSLRAPRS
jgi:hypothetical protein